MPIREYRCPRCKRITERIEFRPDAPPPVCGHESYPGFVAGVKMEPLISVPSTPICKGEGCYKKSS